MFFVFNSFEVKIWFINQYIMFQTSWNQHPATGEVIGDPQPPWRCPLPLLLRVGQQPGHWCLWTCLICETEMGNMALNLHTYKMSMKNFVWTKMNDTFIISPSPLNSGWPNLEILEVQGSSDLKENHTSAWDFRSMLNPCVCTDSIFAGMIQVVGKRLEKAGNLWCVLSNCATRNLKHGFLKGFSLNWWAHIQLPCQT